ncbi:MAG: hypothetical protein L6W00_05140 [Lentisphaeria bacterium]|nr:MAG: hypothetical protein L6W00_05140 [Lentisphaeria bacterium]
MNETDTELDLFSFLQPEPDQAPAPEAADAGSSPEPPAAAPAAPAAPPEKRPLSHAELQQLALGFLVSLNPDAVADSGTGAFPEVSGHCGRILAGRGAKLPQRRTNRRRRAL